MGHIYTNAKGDGIGLGSNNTDAIVVAQGYGIYAANICSELILNGYDDWYLPSRIELLSLLTHKNLIGGFSLITPYWTSTEYSTFNLAYAVDFYGGSITTTDKSTVLMIRAIRRF